MLASTSRPLVAAARATGRRNASAIATKYSGAAYKAALASSPATLTKVSEELSAIAKSLKDTPALNAFVSNPLLSSKERATGLESLYKAGSPKGTVNDITKNLLAVLSENGRLAETPAVIEEFNALVAKYKGELEIVVTSAQPLTKDILTKLEASLKQSEAAKQSKVLKFTNKVMLLWMPLNNNSVRLIVFLKVNPSLLGGMIVDVGDKTIDLSVASRVTKLNNLLQRKLL